MERRIGTRPQRVLVVDDSAEIRELWRLWLNFWGFAVQEAANGAEAVQKARLNPPDLVLMDLWMPVLDGLEATRQLKEYPSTAHVPVVALSAQTVSPEPKEVTEAGAKAFVQKPCDPDELLGHIRSALSRLRAQ
jgi:Response regulator containing CheY-like receiver, AAA-type ATPase, and DNA-binding domains